MKTGKYFKLDDYKNNKIGYGTVDFINLKTIYLKFNSWLLPNDESGDYDLIISMARRKIKEIIYELNSPYFRKECIVDLDIKSNGLKKEKKSFMNLEITLFVNNKFDIKNNDVKKNIKSLTNTIIDNGLNNKILFNFYKTKN